MHLEILWFRPKINVKINLSWNRKRLVDHISISLFICQETWKRMRRFPQGKYMARQMLFLGWGLLDTMTWNEMYLIEVLWFLALAISNFALKQPPTHFPLMDYSGLNNSINTFPNNHFGSNVRSELEIVSFHFALNEQLAKFLKQKVFPH